jgi:hypothetical protein
MINRDRRDQIFPVTKLNRIPEKDDNLKFVALLSFTIYTQHDTGM